MVSASFVGSAEGMLGASGLVERDDRGIDLGRGREMAIKEGFMHTA